MINPKKLFLYLIVYLFCFPQTCFSELIDLGTFGETYEIQEKDIVELIKEKTSDADVKKIQGEYVKKIKEYKPKGFNIEKVSKTGTHYYSPEVVLSEPLLDHKGNILLPAGYSDNPLYYKSFKPIVIFFDGNDEKQINYVLNLSKTIYKDKEIIFIATDGNVFNLMDKHNRRMYFATDFIIKTLDIKHVPSIAYQEGFLIRIDEIVF